MLDTVQQFDSLEFNKPLWLVSILDQLNTGFPRIAISSVASPTI